MLWRDEMLTASQEYAEQHKGFHGILLEWSWVLSECAPQALKFPAEQTFGVGGPEVAVLGFIRLENSKETELWVVCCRDHGIPGIPG